MQSAQDVLPTSERGFDAFKAVFCLLLKSLRPLSQNSLIGFPLGTEFCDSVWVNEDQFDPAVRRFGGDGALG
jgi:hypothetical protein